VGDVSTASADLYVVVLFRRLVPFGDALIYLARQRLVAT
jgi:hypothetical protein